MEAKLLSLTTGVDKSSQEAMLRMPFGTAGSERYWYSNTSNGIIIVAIVL